MSKYLEILQNLDGELKASPPTALIMREKPIKEVTVALPEITGVEDDKTLAIPVELERSYLSPQKVKVTRYRLKK